MNIGLNVLARDWQWLIDTDRFVLLAMSPFGDLLLQDESGTLFLLDINLGVLERAPTPGNDPVVLFPMAFDDRIASGYREAGLYLSLGSCYGYKMPCVVGASTGPENVYVADPIEYISFMGDFHRQIKDIPDGTPVKIKVGHSPQPTS